MKKRLHREALFLCLNFYIQIKFSYLLLNNELIKYPLKIFLIMNIICALFFIILERVVEDSVQQKIIDFLQVGGPVVWILMVFSVVALTIVLLKLWQFSSLRAESLKTSQLALDDWRNGAREESLQKLDEKRPIDALVGYSMRSVLEAKSNVELIREEVERRAMNQLSQFRSFLRPLEIIATLSPLLGLLGTVLGMITAFQQMEGAGSQVDPSVLSGGIWQALLTTAVGLAVAIPVVTLQSWLERKVERIAHNMNDAVTQVFTSKEAKELVEKAAKEMLHAA